MISRTRTVIIATVIIRFVAILQIMLARTLLQSGTGKSLPTSHPPQCFYTSVHIPLTLQQRSISMLNRLPLPMQIRQRTRTNSFRLVCKSLTVLQSLRRPVQPIRSRKKLLSLLKLYITSQIVLICRQIGSVVCALRHRRLFRGCGSVDLLSFVSQMECWTSRGAFDQAIPPSVLFRKL
jgi:hypothetical protein